MILWNVPRPNQPGRGDGSRAAETSCVCQQQLTNPPVACVSGSNSIKCHNSIPISTLVTVLSNNEAHDQGPRSHLPDSESSKLAVNAVDRAGHKNCRIEKTTGLGINLSLTGTASKNQRIICNVCRIKTCDRGHMIGHVIRICRTK